MKKILSSLTVICFLLSGSAFAELNDIPFNIPPEDISLPGHHEFQDEIDYFLEEILQLITEIKKVSSEANVVNECEGLTIMDAPNATKICEIAGVDWVYNGDK